MLFALCQFPEHACVTLHHRILYLYSILFIKILCHPWQAPIIAVPRSICARHACFSSATSLTGFLQER